MKLPELNFSFSGNLTKKPREGNITNKYVPFLNLVTKQTKNNGEIIDDINEFNTKQYPCALNNPLDILILDSPDGSVNLIINDDLNIPKLINSRFSTAENNTYIITDHFTNKDTNLYVEDNLISETSLVKTVSIIPSIEFLGIENNGSFKCGSYYFYFKLCDLDGNETDFIGESGLVVCHIGNVNEPQSIRMGMENENSDKSVLFHITNLDSSYDFLLIYYSRTTSGEDGSDLITYHKILHKFPIKAGSIKLTIFGNEPTQLIDASEILSSYYLCEHAKTHAVAQNTLFLGNILEPIIDYDLLTLFALHIVPYPVLGDMVGSLDSFYKDSNSNKVYTKNITKYHYNSDKNRFVSNFPNVYTFEYYNTKNIYYNVGYWPEEYYRFGIVFILANNSLSPVFNVRGVDWYDKELQESDNKNYITLLNKDIKGDDDGFLLNDDGVKIDNENILGITRMPKDYSILKTARPLGVGFILDREFLEGIDTSNEELHKNMLSLIKKITQNLIKGFFFVRLKRKPIILGLGYLLGKTKKAYGNIPCLQNSKKEYFTESFLSKKHDVELNYTYNILERSYVTIGSSKVENKALLVPDAIIREPLYNLVFLGQKFNLNVISKSNTVKNSDVHYNTLLTDEENIECLSDCLTIPSAVKIKTDGTSYFSSQAGYAEDVSKFISVTYDWDTVGASTVTVGHTPPNNFSYTNMKDCVPMQLKLDLVIRGVFGAYVGITPNDDLELPYGSLINIRNLDYVSYPTNDPSNQKYKDYQKELIYIRNFDSSPYYPISDRLYLKELFVYKEVGDKKYLSTQVIPCFRGDCYSCLFTHRMIRNHTDPELPTNDKIVDPGVWDNNFLVITKTRYEDKESPTGYKYINEIVPLFKAMNLYDDKGRSIKALNVGQIARKIFTFGTGMDPDLINSSEVDAKSSYDLRWGGKPKDGGEVEDALESISIILPNDSRYSKVGSAGSMFGIPNTWYEYGTRNISRSDVNSVGLGHWITVRVLSNYNLYLRDIDKYQISEKVIFGKERGFYPYYPMELSGEYKLPESKLINGACNLSVGQKTYFTLPKMPYIKQQYDTRILYSDVYNGGWKNGFRIFKSLNYEDIPKTYGALVKLIEWLGDLIGVMEHGLLRIPINERVVSGSGSGGDVFINTNNILPKNPIVLSDMIGSTWGESVIKTPSGIYGIDTFSKKIWKMSGGQIPEMLSDFKLLKFLNDNIELSEWDKQCEIGFKNVKTHYNAFKKDIMFTFYNDDKLWNLCYNEYLNQFTTFYSWIPSYSENINNIFLSFDINDSRNILDLYEGFEKTNFYKHLHNRLNIKFYDLGLGIFNGKLLTKTGLINSDPIIILEKLDGNKEKLLPLLYDSTLHKDNKYVQLEEIPANITDPNNLLNNNNIKTHLLKYISSINDLYTFTAEWVENIETTEGRTTSYHTIKFTNVYLLSGEPMDIPELEIKSSDSLIGLSKTTVTLCPTYYSLKLIKEYEKEIQNKKMITIKFKSFYYSNSLKLWDSNIKDYVEVIDPKSLTQKDVYLRLYNPFKCTNEIWKHGQGGIYDGEGDIKPTVWYGLQEPFEFEFVVLLGGWVQNIYHNLLLLSNNVKPEEIVFEIVGDSYDWWKYKDIINFVNKISANEVELKENYLKLLTNTQSDLRDIEWLGLEYPALPDKNGNYNYTIKSIPYIRHIRKLADGKEMNKFTENTTEVCLIEDDLLPEKHIRSTQKCTDIKQCGRIQGNIEYKEDSWWTEIRPVNFKIAYTKDNLLLRFKNIAQSKLRDKYVKIKIKYSGTDLAVIRGVSTLLEPSIC